MTAEERQRIISNDYIDLIIDYNNDLTRLEPFRAYGVNILNIRYAIVQMPYEGTTTNLILSVGYAALPHCYGLTSRINLESSGVLKVRSLPYLNLRGQGVLIGIIDTGIDYTNPIFRYNDGRTRILSIWDQSIYSEENYPVEFFYGAEYRREQINQALNLDNPYDFVPSRDENGHGTALAGVAGGRDSIDENFSGVAPDVEFVIVKLKEAKENIRNYLAIPSDVTCYQENDIMFGVKYVTDVARFLERPISICIGVGTSQGGHDGTNPLSDYLSFMGSIRGVAISIAAGNEGNARSHFYSLMEPSINSTEVELNIGEGETGFTMEFWGDIPSIYSISILSPSGEFVPRIPPRLTETREVAFIMESTVITITYVLVETGTGDQFISVRFRNPSPGIWRFQVFKSGDLHVGFHIWLPMESFISPDTYFIRPDHDTTVLSPGNVVIPITVTAYNPVNESLYINASRGFSRLGKVIIVPDVAAPGVNITVPNLEQGFTTGTGTGIAAAGATGIAAMLLEWGILRGNYSRLDSIGVKKLMIKGARRRSNIVYPNEDWGYGILDVYNIINVLSTDVIID